MTRTEAEKWLQTTVYVVLLKQYFPLAKRVEVRLVGRTRDWGNGHGGFFLTSSGKTFVIELYSGYPWQVIIEWLFHEWAHCRMYEFQTDENQHPPEFHAHLGTIRNFFIDENGGSLKHKHVERVRKRVAKRFNLEGSKV